MDRRKIIKIIAVVILLAAMLIPEVRHYKDGGTEESVSYTHLTLPTIRLV